MAGKPLDLFRTWNNPLRDMARWQAEMERFMQEGYDGNKSAELVPTCEMEETKEAYVLKFEMPGIKKDQVKIELEGNQLTVSAERKEEKTSENKRRHYSEFRYGSFSRTIAFPTPVDETKADAKFENGLLTIMLPKSEPNKSKQVKIQ